MKFGKFVMDDGITYYNKDFECVDVNERIYALKVAENIPPETIPEYWSGNLVSPKGEPTDRFELWQLAYQYNCTYAGMIFTKPGESIQEAIKKDDKRWIDYHRLK